MLSWLAMLKTDTDSFARLVNANRAILIKTLSLLCQNPLSEVSEALTTHAVTHGYVNIRTPPKATALKCWYISEYAPQWACRSAFDLLCQLGWLPKSDIEKAIAARYLLLNNYSISDDWLKLLGNWLIIAQHISRTRKNSHITGNNTPTENQK